MSLLLTLIIGSDNSTSGSIRLRVRDNGSLRAMVGKRQVSPEVYDEKYFLSDSTEGYQEFRDGSVSWVKQRQIEQLELAPGIRMLEIGFGRGEFLYHCAKRGRVFPQSTTHRQP